MKGNGPQDDHEWTIHALNIHGAFFERWCAATIGAAEGWTVVDTRVPVEHSKAGTRSHGAESEIDVVARVRTRGGLDVELLVEAKKNNPEFVRWVFFRSGRSRALGVRTILATKRQDLNAYWDVQSYVQQFSTNAVVVDEGREVREKYQEVPERDRRKVTKTANNAIADAAYQVAVAAQSQTSDEARRWHCRQANSTPETPSAARLYIPAIVTTASLEVCAFEPNDVAAESGELAYGAATLTPIGWLLYEHGLSHHLQIQPEPWMATPVKRREQELVARMPIFVVNAGHLAEFLGSLWTDDGFISLEENSRVRTALPDEVRNRR